MRRSLALATLFALAACGGRPEEENSFGGGSDSDASASVDSEVGVDAAGAPASRNAQSAGPNVAPTAAPGVAFNYRYAFRMEADRIAPVVEQHAAFCERQGVARCRIVGMEYRRHGDGDVTARLSVKLAPDIARRYGQVGVQAVLGAEGTLVESEISGTDVAPRIRSATRAAEGSAAELTRLEAQLRRPDIRPLDREALEYQAQQLRASLQASRDDRDAAQSSLAQTPLTFQYGSGDRVPGYGDEGPTMRQAAEQAKDNFFSVLTGLIIVLVTLLPFALFALAAWALWAWARRIWRRFEARRDAAAAVPAAEA